MKELHFPVLEDLVSNSFEENETIFSKRGAILSSDSNAKRIVLEDGLILSNDTDRASLLRFERMESMLPEFEEEKDVPLLQNIIATIYLLIKLQKLVSKCKLSEMS